MTRKPTSPCRPLAALVAVSLLALAAVAQAAEQGARYQRIVPPQPTAAPEGQIEVVEVFWYGCPHCYHFEPLLRKWLEKLPADVHFRRVPAVFRRNWVAHARAYYTAEALGVVDAVHEDIFDAIHQRGERLADEDSLAALFAAHGVDEARFRQVYDSLAVQTKVRQAMALTRGYGITGVPSMVVQGRYRTSGRLAGSYEAMLKEVDALVEKERERIAHHD